jgi:filamentous hemagglutinin family protein
MNRHGSMNRIYRLVWSAVRSVWIPVAETARGRGKRSTPALVAAALSLTCAVAQASPSGGQVTAGTGSITQSGSTTTITQSTQNLSLNWASFNIAPQQSVNFVQPSTSAIAVNRILGTNGTQILGYLHANGQVFLINPNGIVFGPTAEVNVDGLVASTLDLDEAGSTGNAKSFNGTGTGSVLNEGALTATPGGYVVLLGNHVSNEGVISAQLGSVALGAGSAVALTFDGNSRVRLQVDQSVLNSLAENGGLIRADGGQVIMSAGAKDALMASVVNNTGVIEARTVDTHDGTITLLGGMTAGTVNVAGALDASAPDGGNGGQINTSAAHVEVASNARVTSAARDGLFGSWLIDPEDYTVAASGGDITGAALSSNLATTDIVVQSSGGTKNPAGLGVVNVNDAVTWSTNTTLTLTAANNVNVNANITASGATAGLIINPNTANTTGSSVQSASGSGTFNLTGASITLTGATPFLSIGGTTYTVINTLGAPGSMTATDLQGMNGNLAANYALGSNIDASATATSPWAASGFTPIGTSSTPFTGTFDGLGHTISGLTINLPTADDVGLFGYTGVSSVVRNVGLIGGSVSGNNNVGALIGNNFGTVLNSYATGSVNGNGNNVGGLLGLNDGTVLDDYASGSVTGSGNNTGGLVGSNNAGGIMTSYATGSVNGSNTMSMGVGGLVGGNYGSISNSYATGSVTGGWFYVGGLAGGNFANATINNSYATGSVTGVYYVGGLVGFDNDSAVSNSYATGSVSGGEDVGGVVGSNYGATLTNTYSVGSVSGQGNVGGVAGFNHGTITNSYWNTTTNATLLLGIGGGYSTGTTGLSTGQMQTHGNFAGFDFTPTPGVTGDNWVMVDTDGTLNNAGGALGATFPMLASEYSTVITNAHQLQLMVMALGASYTLAADIDAANTDTSTNLNDVWSTSGGFVPIGSNSANFTGRFDGLGHTISNLTINLPVANGVGLFGFTSANSAIQNVALAGGSVAGGSNTGDLVGQLGGMLYNSYATGDVTGTGGPQIGGLVGFNISGTVNNSYATGNVMGGSSVGGLVGLNYGAIANSYATGMVSGSNYVGGLVGYHSGSISNSHATGNVSGSNYVGGLVGYHSGSISNSYAAGNVAGTASVGGLAGRSNSGAVVTGSYATGAVSGAGSVGGLVGYNYGAITGSHATGAVTGTAGISSSVGGLAGNSYGSATITNSYATGAVTGYTNVGGLAGSNTGTITSSSANGNVSSTNVTAGGLVGNNPNGTITNSFATGTVTGSSYVGGLVGSASGAISDSHASGDVTSAGRAVGGLVGSFQSGTISNSYAAGSVTGGSYVGGLAGTQSGTVTNSYATGLVTGTGQLVGGLVGFGTGTISYSHATGDVNGAGATYVGGLVGNISYEGTLANSYATGAVTGTTEVGGLVGSNNNDTISNSYATGTVSGGSYVGGLAGTSQGAITTSHATGAVSTGSGPGAGGLVGFDHGAINNSYATGAVSGGSYVGGLVGEGGTQGTAPISNSYATGTVTGGTGVGGLVGKNDLTISNSYATGNVHGSGTDVGGLVGTNGANGGGGNYGTISNSYATGTVAGASSNSGGLVGTNYGGVSNSYATGSVSAGSVTGGLVGLNANGGGINDSYATGSVTGAGNIGGLVGNNLGTVMFSFWNTDIVAVGIGGGAMAGAQGLTTAAMMTMSNFSNAGWNIADTGGSGDVWRIYEDNTAPLLVSFLTPLTVTAQNTAHTYTGTAVTALTDASYSISGAATSGHIFNINNPYNGAVNVGTHGAALYSDQQGYDISYVGAMLTLTPATLTVTANTAGKAYGQANPVLSGTVTGFVGGDTLASATSGSETYATAATASSNVGIYGITGTGLTANDGNYIFSFATANATAFTITPATLTVSGEVAASRVYNGTTDATLTGGTLAGMGSGETVTLTQAGHFTSPDAGTAIAVTVTDSIAGNGAGNYILVEPTDITANITPATLTYTAAAASFTAGQTPSGLTGTLAGFVAGETQLNATTGSLSWTTTAGAASGPGRYAIDGSGLTATNYIFVDALANATALTLLTPTTPPSGSTTAALVKAQNAVTSIETNLPSSQTNIQLAMLDASSNITVTQDLDVDTGAATEAADNIVLDKRSVHGAMLPSLRIVRGGVKLPQDEASSNAP